MKVKDSVLNKNTLFEIVARFPTHTSVHPKIITIQRIHY